MSRDTWRSALAVALLPVPLGLCRPELADALAWAGAGTRPAVLPFAWSAMLDSLRWGNAEEAFAKSQQLMQLLPSWIDGHLVFAYRYALDGGDRAASATSRAAMAKARLVAALAALERARPAAGRREIEMLEAMAFLPEVAVRQEPELEMLLRPDGGAPALADHYYAEAERLGASRTVREHRTFRAVALAAALLRAADRAGALAVLDTAITRSSEVADTELAAAWRDHLIAAAAHLRGAPADLTPVLADPRFEPLWPHLR